MRITEQDGEHIAVAMTGRADQIKVRLVTGMVIALLFGGVSGRLFAGCWLVAYALLQIVEFKLGPTSPLAQWQGPRRYGWTAILLVFLGHGVFGSFAIMEAFNGGTLGAACAGLMIGGGMVNAVMVSARSRKLVAVSLAPQFVYFILLPVAVLSGGLGAREAIQITLSAGLLVLTSLAAWIRFARTLADMDAAQQAAEKANRAKSNFLATMSHELRTPLNGVLGMAQAIAHENLSDRQKARLDVVMQSGQTLLSIIDDILDLAKIEESRIELDEASFDMALLLEHTCGAFAATAAAKNLQFDLEIEPAVHGAFTGDAGRVGQILSNMISNALKFTADGQVTITASRHNDEIRLEIADTGPGVAPDQLERLFDKFVQADASTTRLHGGTGLGLSICQGFARAMGGRMEARLREPRGLVVTAVLPLKRVQPLTATLPAPPAAEDGAEAWVDERPLRVLAAEDHPINQQVLMVLLEQAGITPHLVKDGAEAVEAWRRADWDLILMDVRMPVMDGPTAARTIRDEERASGRRYTPIVAVTANVMAHQLDEYRAVGMAQCVAKPIQMATLLDAIDAALAEEEPGKVLPFPGTLARAS